VVLIDATDAWGSGYLLPRGGLREPKRNLRRAGFAILTRCDAVDQATIAGIEGEVRRFAPNVPVARTIHAPTELLNGRDTADVVVLSGKPTGAFCGIGNPAGFRRTLADLGADVQAFREYPDHHPYSRDDVDDLCRWAATLPVDSRIVTTQKDWVKLRLTELGGRSLWALRVGLDFLDGKDRFDRAVLTAAGRTAEAEA
jgi:tetraacyldisaccharide 4'-kinase